MAQLSIFDNKRRRSSKDFSCSVGQLDFVYMTFRHYSWRRFTSSEKIRIRVEGRVLKFDDPERDEDHGGAVFKLFKSQHGYPSTIDSTRYVKLDGKAWPGILEVVKRTAGSYDIPKTTEPDEETRAKAEENKIALDDFTRQCLKKHGRVKDAPTSEELAREHRPELEKLAEVLSSDRRPLAVLDSNEKTIRQLFMDDALTLCQTATSTEERTAIYNALAVVYGLRYNGTVIVPEKNGGAEGGKSDGWDIP